MLLQVMYEDIKGYKAVNVNEDKREDAKLRVSCANLDDFKEAYDSYKNTNNIVSVEFVTNTIKPLTTLDILDSEANVLSILKIDIGEYLGAKNIFLKDLDEKVVNAELLQLINELEDTIQKGYTLVFKFPGYFTNMRILDNIKKQNKGIRICGGDFLRILDIPFGCIGPDNYKLLGLKVVPKQKLKIDGCSCIMKTRELSDLEYYVLEKEASKKTILSNVEKVALKSEKGDTPKKVREGKKSQSKPNKTSKKVASFLQDKPKGGFANF